MGPNFYFEDYAALFVFLLTSFFWHFVTKFVELSTIKNLLNEGFLVMEDLRGLALNKIAQVDLF